MALYLREADVQKVLTMKGAISALRTGVQQIGEGNAQNYPRQVVDVGNARLSILPAGIPNMQALGFKAYTVGLNDALRFWVMLFNISGEIEAIVEAEYLSAVRTGAATGVATDLLAPQGSQTLGIIGTGYNAPAQIEAICEVRKINNVLAFSRNSENLADFCDTVKIHYDINIVPAESVRDVVEKSDILVTVTSSADPVFDGSWLQKGVHVNLVGAMKSTRREIDDVAVNRADLIVVDDIDQGKMEAGELISAASNGMFNWNDSHSLASCLVSGVPADLPSDAITIFKSHGVGVWDVSVGAHVLEQARCENIGTNLAIDHDATPLYKGTFHEYFPSETS